MKIMYLDESVVQSDATRIVISGWIHRSVL